MNPFDIPEIAASYPQVEDYYGPAVDRILSLFKGLGLPTGLELVDLGAGSGLAAAGLVAANYRNVTLVDPSKSMLDLARKRIGRRARYQVAGVDDLAKHFAGTVQGMLAANCYQYFPNKARALDSISKVLAPGGYFLFNLAMPQYRFTDADEADLAILRLQLAFYEKLRILTRMAQLEPVIMHLQRFLAGGDQRPLERDDMEAVLSEFDLVIDEDCDERLKISGKSLAALLRLHARLYCENADLVERIIERLDIPPTLLQRQAFFVTHKREPRARATVSRA